MFSIFQQAGYFLYRNYLYFLPVIIAFALLANLITQPQMPDDSKLSMTGLIDFYTDSNLFLLPLTYLFGFPFVLTIANRRINQPDESVGACLSAALVGCWYAVFGFVLVVFTLGAGIYLLLSLLTQLIGLNAGLLYFVVVGLAIYVMLRLSLLLPALIEDRLPPHKAALQSFFATRGRMMMVLGAYALIIAMSIGALVVLNLISLLVGERLSLALTGLVDVHLNVLLLIVFYRMYLLDKTPQE